MVENNFLVECASCGLRVIDSCAYRPAAGQMRNYMRGNRFCRNIVYSIEAETRLFALGVRADNPIAESDRNLYCAPRAHWAIHNELPEQESLPEHTSLAQWQELGFDPDTPSRRTPAPPTRRGATMT